MLVCLGLSIFLRGFLGLLYGNMIRETDNMAATENKLLKQCKLKFANCFELSGGVSNIPVFVDRFLNRLALGRLSFQMLYHLSGQMMLLSVVFSGIGVCRCIIRGKTLGDILPFYIVSFLGLYLFFSVSTIVDIKGKRRTLKINLVDYLENHLSPRIDVTRQDLEMLYGEAAFRESGSAGPWNGRAGRRQRAGISGNIGTAAGRRERRTVELMPIAGRNAADKSNEDKPCDSRQSGEKTYTDRQQEEERQKQSAVTEEELEALLKEFLTT